MKLTVKVHPNATSEKLELVNGQLVVFLKNKAQKGEANRALVKLLSKRIGCDARDIRLVSGATSHKKTLIVPDIDLKTILD